MLRLGLALLAALSQAAPPGPGDEAYRYYYEDVYRPFFELDAPGSRYRAARPGANPGSFPARKAPGTFRVFLVGGSTMAGFNGPLSLQEALDRVLPKTKVEVLNCGMSGYDSGRELLVTRELARYEPDAVVFLTGHNDFFILNSAPPPRLLAPLYRRLGRLPSPAPAGRRLALLLDNAREQWRLARAAGAEPIAALPPLNYRDNAPGLDVPLEEPAVAGGLRLLAAGRRAEARALWESASASASPRARPFLLFERALAADEAREHALAERLFLEATDDPEAYPLCGRACRSALGTAAERAGASVADLDASFRAAVAPRMPGFDAFTDTLHWQTELNGTVSAAIIKAMASAPRLSPWPWDRKALAQLEKDARGRAGLWTAERRKDRRDKLLYYASAETRTARRLSLRAAVWLAALVGPEPGLGTPAALSAAAGEVAARRKRFRHLGQEGMEDDPGGALLRLNLAAAQARLGRRREALRLLESLDAREAEALRRALDGRPPSRNGALHDDGGNSTAAPAASTTGRRLRSWAARALTRAGLSGAGLAYMSRWHARRPSELTEADLRDWLSLASGPHAGAAGLAALERLEALPLAAEDWPTLARAWQRYGRPERALGWWDRALAREPGSARLMFERALALHGAGRRSDALAGLKAAVAADPRLAEGWLSLGTLLEQEGRKKEAAAAYRAGAELDAPVRPLLRESLDRVAPRAQ